MLGLGGMVFAVIFSSQTQVSGGTGGSFGRWLGAEDGMSH